LETVKRDDHHAQIAAISFSQWTSTKEDEMAQPPKRRICGQTSAHAMLLEQNPGRRQKLAAIEKQTQSRIAAPAALAALPIITIPVVVHVVYRTALENISDAQIKSQIDALNRDFGLTNADRNNIPSVWAGLAVDTRIRFKLVKKAPDGSATTGITRTKTALSVFGSNDGVKRKATGGVDAWPTDKYLNLWVCTLGGGLLGYAQFPGMPKKTDGVVILNTAFGTNGTAASPFNNGRTAVHEVGHWLNLRHIWGDTEDCTGSDFVSDTPFAKHPNRGAPAFPHISCQNGPNGDMFMNYMDYVDDRAMIMFTTGQVARMQATLAGPRISIPANAAALI
jgi:hypothetical protein